MTTNNARAIYKRKSRAKGYILRRLSKLLADAVLCAKKCKMLSVKYDVERKLPVDVASQSTRNQEF